MLLRQISLSLCWAQARRIGRMRPKASAARSRTCLLPQRYSDTGCVTRRTKSVTLPINAAWPPFHDLCAMTQNSHRQPCARRELSYRFAKKFASKRRPRCAIPGCHSPGVKQKCCKQPLCVACQARTLRTAFDDRLRTRCPYCRKTLLRPDSVVKKLMCAFPSHAMTIECEGGPPAALAHFPCPQGRYDSRESAVRLLSIAQKQMLSSAQARLDIARAKNAQLTQSLAAMRCQKDTKVVSPEEKDFASKHGECCAGVVEKP